MASTTLRDEYHSLLVSASAAVAAEIPTSLPDDHRDTTRSSSAVDISTISLNSSSANDSAITPADTLLVIDMQHDFLSGGAFGVAEGDTCIDGICNLIAKFNLAGATVIASRDYHPRNHCSFIGQGGPFPEHCVQATYGSFLHPQIANALQPLLKEEGEKDSDSTKRTHIVYKAFSKDIDSFGAVQYKNNTGGGKDDTNTAGGWKDRISHNSHCDAKHCSLEWTGGYNLYSSNLCEDANAPPDVMSVFEKKPLIDLLPTKKSNGEKGSRIFVCGLAYDYCVIDTAVNYCEYIESQTTTQKNNNNENSVFIVQDLTRAAQIPGVGTFGSGFLTDPKTILDKLTKHKIGLVRFV